MGDVLILGASRGLGASMARELENLGDLVWSVSRSKPSFFDSKKHFWIGADLADPLSALEKVREAIGTRPINLLVYNAGIAEKTGFEELNAQAIMDIFNVNIVSALVIIQALLNNIKAGVDPQVILIGSTCGLENEGDDGVVYAASKFAMRGATHALREIFRNDYIRVTCISPGSIASEIGSENVEAALLKHNKKRIPAKDIIDIIKCLRSLSIASCVKEIHIPATADEDV